MDSLLEKKLENPRMSLEGKLECLNTAYGTKNAYKILIVCVFFLCISDNN